jgi:hypothetical protein
MADRVQKCSSGAWILFQKNWLFVPGYQGPYRGDGLIFVNETPYHKFNFVIPPATTTFPYRARNTMLWVEIIADPIKSSIPGLTPAPSGNEANEERGPECQKKI